MKAKLLKKKLKNNETGLLDFVDSFGIDFDVTDRLVALPSSDPNVERVRVSPPGMDATNEGLNHLIVKVVATHSGKIINGRVYPPDKVSSAVDSWTDPYKRPVLRNHNDDDDPIGRVIDAEYVDMSDDIEDVSEVPYTKGGLGHILLTLDISDPDAIQKILDGRYFTVSQRLSTNSLVCSVCDSDWIKGDYCEHESNKFYDGERCYFKAGDISYKEISFVNIPADDVAFIQTIGGDSEDSEILGFYSNQDLMVDLLSSDRVNLFDSDRGKTILSKLDMSVPDIKKTKSKKENDKEENYMSVKDKTKKAADAAKDVKDKVEIPAEEKYTSKAFQEAIDALSREKQDLVDQLEAAKKELADKTEQNTVLVDENANLSTSLRKSLADRLVDLKMALDKPDARAIETAEDRSALVDTYIERSMDSLQDAIDDLLLERLDKEMGVKDKEDDKGVDFNDDSKIEDDSLAQDEKTKDQKDSEKEEPVVLSKKDSVLNGLFGKKKNQ